jgi:uncharacterized protein YodC (DUF2158 family)
MKENTPNEIKRFKASLESLFKDIERWIVEFGLIVLKEEIKITEEASGEYCVEKLIIKKNDGFLAEVVPIGAWILGANGRVDIVGNEDRIILVDLNEGGPSMSISDGETEQRHVRKFFKGIDEAGWYWIDRSTSHGYKITKDVFINLLSEASGYDFR